MSLRASENHSLVFAMKCNKYPDATNAYLATGNYSRGQEPGPRTRTAIHNPIEDTENSSLRPFGKEDENSIPFDLKDYLELVDWGGREVKRNKRGYIPASAPPILIRLKMDAAPVLDYLAKGGLSSFGALGPVSLLRAFAKSIGRKFIKGHALGDGLWPERV